MTFWACVVKPGDKSQYVPPPGEPCILHVSQAACDIDAKTGARVALQCESEGRTATLCVLTAGRAENASLDIMLTSDAVFTVKGNAAVHVTGYLLPDDEEIDSDEFDSSDEDELASPWGFFDADADEEGESDDEEDYDDEDYEDASDEANGDKTGKAKTKKGGVMIEELEEDEDEDGDDESEEDDEDDEEIERQKVLAMKHAAAEAEEKRRKKEAAAAKAKAEAKAKADKGKKRAAEAEAPTEKPSKKKGKANDEPEEAGVRTRRFESGLEIKYLKAGKPNGKVATAGRKVGMRYVGRLTNGKQFDASGKRTFSFRLGVGEVIKGWDAGVQGMKVGEKRRLTVPPKLGYGARGAPPTIPGNATLVFDVECVEVR